MKNQNLKKAFRELDKAYLQDSASAPAEEMYYSPEYEKKMNRLLGKKKEKTSFSGKAFWQRAGVFALGAAFALGIVAALPKSDPVDETPTKEYEAIDFVDTSYVVYSADPTVIATKNGYKEGTYEYEYLAILSEISYYSAIARYYVATSVYDISEKNPYIGGFYEYVSKEEICAPYDDILLHAFEILEACGFAPAELSYQEIFDYHQDLPYEKDRAILGHCPVLSLGNLHEKLTENAEALLSLDKHYPDYSGEFFVSSYVLERADALIEACKPVYENKIKHLEAWCAYYDMYTPTLEVTEEFIAELDAVKITIGGNGLYRTPALASRVIEIYEYEIFTNSYGYLQKNQLPASSITIYMPVHSYFGHNASNGIAKQLYIEKYDHNNDRYEVRYELTLDPTQYYSNELVTMNNESLDAILRGYFGGDYSERDLLNVQGICIQYFEYEGYPSKAPELFLDVWNGTKYVRLSCELDLAGAGSEEIFIEELAEDLRHFHAGGIQTSGAADRFVSDELAKELNPYYVNPDDDIR